MSELFVHIGQVCQPIFLSDPDNPSRHGFSYCMTINRIRDIRILDHPAIIVKYISRSFNRHAKHPQCCEQFLKNVPTFVTTIG
jgi:hypothetical protein